MKRTILAGAIAIVTLAAGASGLWAQKQPAPKSKGEQQALQALGAAQQKNDPNEIIKAAEDLITKFADTEFKEIALSMEARAYQMKGDSIKAQIYAEQVLQANPNSLDALMLLGQLIAQSVGEHDLDREEKLAKAEKCLKQAGDQLGPAPKPPLNEQQWKYSVADVHSGLGMVAEARKNFDVAATEYKTASETVPEDKTFVARYAHALQSGGKNDEAVAACDKILEDKDVNPQIRNYVQNVRATAIKAGGKAAGK